MHPNNNRSQANEDRASETVPANRTERMEEILTRSTCRKAIHTLMSAPEVMRLIYALSAGGGASCALAGALLLLLRLNLPRLRQNPGDAAAPAAALVRRRSAAMSVSFSNSRLSLSASCARALLSSPCADVRLASAPASSAATTS